MRWAACVLVAATAMLSGCSAAPAPTPDDRADATLFIYSALDSAWSGGSRLDRPPPHETTFYLPNGWGSKIEECMFEAGFTGFRSDPAGGFADHGAPVSVHGRVALARYSCGARYPTYSTRYSEPDDQQLDGLYAYYVDRLIPCLALEGVVVGDLPTRAQFGHGGEGQPGSWNPYLGAELPASVNVAAALIDGCGPYPEGFTAPG